MAHHPIPVYTDSHIFWALSSIKFTVNRIRFLLGCMWESDEIPETLPALRILQIYKKQLQKLWSFLTEYMRCCLRLTQLTETDSIEPAIKMGTFFI